MPDSVVDTAAALERALSAPGWLLLGVMLHLANQVARGRGWYALLRPACEGVRRRDAIATWVAGAEVIGRMVRRRRKPVGPKAPSPGGARRRVLAVLSRVGCGCTALTPGAF